MSEEPANKKIKLSLEPFIDNNVVDITNTGQEILKTETSLPEKLMQSVDRIWFERGEWRDITEASLLESIQNKNQGNEENEQLQTHDTDDKENAFAPPPGFDINKLRESVINKLFHAKSEIDVALDVINILAASSRASATVKDLVLPVGSLTATYVTKPKPTTKAQLESVQLNLGLKRKKQKQASEFLKNSAEALKKIVEKDQVFWEEALDLRRNNWQMQANPQHGSVHAGSSFLVQYGFTDVGSDFSEAAIGELKRSDDNANQLQMSLPHGTPRKMAVRINQSNMGRLGLGKNNFSEGILGMMNEEKQDTEDQKQNSVYFTTMIGTSHSEIQNQLAEAYSTVFDAELFSDILAEAQALNSNVRFPDDEIVINIDGQIDLSISKIPVTPLTLNEEKITTPQQIISRSIDLAFRLLLLQHQRYNVWRTKARTLSHNHRIKQLLLQSEILQQQQQAQQQQQQAQQQQQQQQAQQQQQQGSTATSTVGTPSSTVIASNAAAATNNPTTPSNTTTAAANASATASVSTPSVAGGNTVSASSRARTKTVHLQTSNVQRDLPKQIPILSPIMSLMRFWVQFDRVRHVLHQITSPFRYGGFSITTHFKFANKGSWMNTFSYDAYPGYGELALSLGISILKGPSLHFELSQSGAISVCLPQTTVVLQNVSEFEAFLSREIKVICLMTVCEVANDIIQQTEGYRKASGSDKKSFLWRLDRVDEAIHGTIYWNKQWRNMTIRLNLKEEQVPFYVLEFRLNEMQDVKECTYEIELGKSSTPPSAMNFKEKVTAVVKKIMRDAQIIIG